MHARGVNKRKAKKRDKNYARTILLFSLDKNKKQERKKKNFTRNKNIYKANREISLTLT